MRFPPDPITPNRGLRNNGVADPVDIDDMAQAGAIHPAVIAATVHGILGSDPRVERLLAIPRDGPRPQPTFPATPKPVAPPAAAGPSNDQPRWGAWMTRSRARCSLPGGHKGHHKA